MDIEKLKTDIFVEFGLKIDEDDPLWAFIFVNEKITSQFAKIIYDTLKSRDEKLSEINSILSSISKINSDIDKIAKSIVNASDKVDTTVKDYQEVADQIRDNLNVFSNKVDSIIKNIDLSNTEKIIKDKIEQSVKEIPTDNLRVEVEKLNNLYTKLSSDREEFDSLVTKKSQQINSATENIQSIYKKNILIAGVIGVIGSSLLGGVISYWQSKVYYQENFNKKVNEKVKGLKSINEEINKLIKSRVNFKIEVDEK